MTRKIGKKEGGSNLQTRRKVGKGLGQMSAQESRRSLQGRDKELLKQSHPPGEESSGL